MAIIAAQVLQNIEFENVKNLALAGRSVVGVTVTLTVLTLFSILIGPQDLQNITLLSSIFLVIFFSLVLSPCLEQSVLFRLIQVRIFLLSLLVVVIYLIAILPVVENSNFILLSLISILSITGAGLSVDVYVYFVISIFDVIFEKLDGTLTADEIKGRLRDEG